MIWASPLVTFKILLQSVLLRPRAGSHKQSVERLIRDVDKIIEKTRHLTAALRPSTLQVLGLTTATKVLIAEFQRKDLKINLKHDDLDRITFEGDSINFYRILQEALTNIIKHAQASHVHINVDIADNQLVMTIVDNGRGFSPSESEKHSSRKETQGLGLSTMRERARLLKGDLEVSSVDQQGNDRPVESPRRSKVPTFSVIERMSRRFLNKIEEVGMPTTTEKSLENVGIVGTPISIINIQETSEE